MTGTRVPSSFATGQVEARVAQYAAHDTHHGYAGLQRVHKMSASERSALTSHSDFQNSFYYNFIRLILKTCLLKKNCLYIDTE